MYPWASFGTFVFKRSETALWGTDAGWVLTPSVAQSRPVGSTKDHAVAISIGSRTRSFEINLEADRQAQLEALLNTTAVFTDWERPIPDSRSAYLLEVALLDKFIHQSLTTGQNKPARRFRLTLVSQ